MHETQAARYVLSPDVVYVVRGQSNVIVFIWPSNALSCVTGKVRVTPSSVSEEPSNEVKASASTPRQRQMTPYQHVSELETGQNYRSPGNGDTCVEPVDRRGSHKATSVGSDYRYWSTVTDYRGDRNLAAYIVERHSGQTPSVMVWGAIGYNMRSRLLRIEGNLNSSHYIREVLEPQALSLLQATLHAIFQQDNARPHMARNVQDFEHIQVLFDSMPRRLGVLIAARAGFTPYWIVKDRDHRPRQRGVEGAAKMLATVTADCYLRVVGASVLSRVTLQPTQGQAWVSDPGPPVLTPSLHMTHTKFHISRIGHNNSKNRVAGIEPSVAECWSIPRVASSHTDSTAQCGVCPPIRGARTLCNHCIAKLGLYETRTGQLSYNRQLACLCRLAECQERVVRNTQQVACCDGAQVTFITIAASWCLKYWQHIRDNNALLQEPPGNVNSTKITITTVTCAASSTEVLYVAVQPGEALVDTPLFLTWIVLHSTILTMNSVIQHTCQLRVVVTRVKSPLERLHEGRFSNAAESKILQVEKTYLITNWMSQKPQDAASIFCGRLYYQDISGEQCSDNASHIKTGYTASAVVPRHMYMCDFCVLPYRTANIANNTFITDDKLTCILWYVTVYQRIADITPYVHRLLYWRQRIYAHVVFCSATIDVRLNGKAAVWLGKGVADLVKTRWCCQLCCAGGWRRKPGHASSQFSGQGKSSRPASPRSCVRPHTLCLHQKVVLCTAARTVHSETRLLSRVKNNFTFAISRDTRISRDDFRTCDISIPYERTSSFLLLIGGVCGATPFLTELHVIGAHNCEVFFIGAELPKACQEKYGPMTNVLQRLAGFSSQWGRSRIFAYWNRAKMIGGFSRGSPVSPAHSFRRCSILISLTLIGSQDLDVKSRPNLFIHVFNTDRLEVEAFKIVTRDSYENGGQKCLCCVTAQLLPLAASPLAWHATVTSLPAAVSCPDNTRRTASTGGVACPAPFATYSSLSLSVAVSNPANLRPAAAYTGGVWLSVDKQAGYCTASADDAVCHTHLQFSVSTARHNSIAFGGFKRPSKLAYDCVPSTGDLTCPAPSVLPYFGAFRNVTPRVEENNRVKANMEEGQYGKVAKKTRDTDASAPSGLYCSYDDKLCIEWVVLTFGGENDSSPASASKLILCAEHHVLAPDALICSSGDIRLSTVGTTVYSETHVTTRNARQHGNIQTKVYKINFADDPSRRSPRGQHYTPEEEPKSCCGVVVTQAVSIRWFIVMIAFVGICCAVVGTVLGAMKASGRDHLTVSLLMIGECHLHTSVKGPMYLQVQGQEARERYGRH
ncbi:hypothetical protein PR048_009055 [Dryococelus australis]|uniref:Uncharacterized protein n=1 Tax=Dryococelus australis TaxID=614101 RepID=A0ABQ9HYU4_9NEOP|nr:hypothetical protein PR048_009055 [Dryococelus australis]